MLGFFFYYRKLFRVGEPRPSQSPSVTAIALSVTCGDSSPRGRAKGILPLPLGEVAERSEDGEGEDGASVP